MKTAQTRPARRVVLERQAKDTLTAVEMNHGDTLKFRLRSGRVCTLVLERTAARILERAGGVLYQFTARVRIDGQPITLLRYVGSQESFYEPYVINGMRIWLDAVSDIFRLIPMRKMEVQRIPHKQARFALQDATLPICPQPMRPWYANDRNFIDIKDCYNGDDCWLGAYLGRACHGGLDINHPKGDPLRAPIDFDDQWLFNSLAAGHNNNRWRGVRKWPGGDVWALQTHHIIKLLVPEHTPLKAGTKYATAAGVHVGSHNHTHYVFKIAPKHGGPEIHLDPWILFRQIFETRKAHSGAIRAGIKPLAPARTGQPVRFSTSGSRSGPRGGTLRYYWTFGDGGGSSQARPTHTFARPGVYPVTLVVDDGVDRAAGTQHMTVDGKPVKSAALALAAAGEVGFRPRPVGAMDVYGWPVRRIPHTLEFLARPSRPVPRTKTIRLKNIGKGALPEAARPKITYEDATGWLSVEAKGRGNAQTLAVAVDASGLKPGTYAAVVTVDCPPAVNSPQAFRVVLSVPKRPPASHVTIDDRDGGFACTPYFWVGHRFLRCRNKGFRGFYLTNGGRALPRRSQASPWRSRAAAGEVARFTPDLKAGRYEVSFHESTPFRPGSRFNVRVRHKGGESVVRVQPGKSRRIGTFDFDEGADGFVEILSRRSTGLVVADAVVFKRGGAPRRLPN